jgi:hypothetical protein
MLEFALGACRLLHGMMALLRLGYGRELHDNSQVKPLQIAMHMCLDNEVAHRSDAIVPMRRNAQDFISCHWLEIVDSMAVRLVHSHHAPIHLDLYPKYIVLIGPRALRVGLISLKFISITAKCSGIYTPSMVQTHVNHISRTQFRHLFVSHSSKPQYKLLEPKLESAIFRWQIRVFHLARYLLNLHPSHAHDVFPHPKHSGLVRPPRHPTHSNT